MPQPKEMTRRDFLKTAGILAGTAIAGPVIKGVSRLTPVAEAAAIVPPTNLFPPEATPTLYSPEQLFRDKAGSGLIRLYDQLAKDRNHDGLVQEIESQGGIVRRERPSVTFQLYCGHRLDELVIAPYGAILELDSETRSGIIFGQIRISPENIREFFVGNIESIKEFRLSKRLEKDGKEPVNISEVYRTESLISTPKKGNSNPNTNLEGFIEYLYPLRLLTRFSPTDTSKKLWHHINDATNLWYTAEPKKTDNEAVLALVRIDQESLLKSVADKSVASARIVERPSNGKIDIAVSSAEPGFVDVFWVNGAGKLQETNISRQHFAETADNNQLGVNFTFWNQDPSGFILKHTLDNGQVFYSVPGGPLVSEDKLGELISSLTRK